MSGTSSDGALWLKEQDVVDLMDLGDAIDALGRSVAAEQRGDARNMNKTMLQFGKSNLHALGGQLGDVVGTKSWVHAEGGTSPLLLLWGAHDGQLLAVIEAFALGNLRTGATSGLATQWLSAPDAHTMAILGTGKQALAQVAAVAAVRPLTEVRVFGRDETRRTAFAQRVNKELDLRAVGCASVAEATRGAEVVTVATRASEPLLFADQLAPGAHVNAIGAIGPDREELAQDVFPRATVVCVDHLPATQQLSREFKRYFDQPDRWPQVRTLGDVVAATKKSWRPDGLSLFKAMGMGLSDVALGASLLDRARAQGRGRPIDTPRKTPIRLRRTLPAAVTGDSR
jgi:alanine dehydrogenase